MVFYKKDQTIRPLPKRHLQLDCNELHQSQAHKSSVDDMLHVARDRYAYRRVPGVPAINIGQALFLQVAVMEVELRIIWTSGCNMIEIMFSMLKGISSYMWIFANYTRRQSYYCERNDCIH